MGTKSITLVLVAGLILVFGLTGCNTSSKGEKITYAADGKTMLSKEKTKTSESAMVMQSMAPAIKACEDGIATKRRDLLDRKIKENSIPFLTADQLLGLKSGAAQDKYIDKAFTFSIIQQMGNQTELVVAAFKKPPITCAQAVAMAVDSYMEKEGIQAKQWGSTGLALAIAVPTAWVLTKAMSIMDNAIAGQGDHINTGDINMTKSDDPLGGGEGSPGGDVTGGQSLQIGSGQQATGHGQAIDGAVDKNINTGFGSKSSSNLDESTQPNTINDADTVKDNSVGLVPVN